MAETFPENAPLPSGLIDQIIATVPREKALTIALAEQQTALALENGTKIAQLRTELSTAPLEQQPKLFQQIEALTVREQIHTARHGALWVKALDIGCTEQDFASVIVPVEQTARDRGHPTAIKIWSQLLENLKPPQTN